MKDAGVIRTTTSEEKAVASVLRKIRTIKSWELKVRQKTQHKYIQKPVKEFIVHPSPQPQ